MFIAKIHLIVNILCKYEQCIIIVINFPILILPVITSNDKYV